MKTGIILELVIFLVVYITVLDYISLDSRCTLMKCFALYIFTVYVGFGVISILFVQYINSFYLIFMMKSLDDVMLGD